MSEVIPLAFEAHLVRAIQRGAEPWFVGNDVCACLGIKKPRNSLELLDPDERGAHTVGTPSGDQSMIIVSEPGVYRLVFRSRKPEAERFKRWLAHDVLPQLRKTGKYGNGEPLEPGPDAASWPIHVRLRVVRQVHEMFGPHAGKSMWTKLGLPAVPVPQRTPLDEAYECLRMLLDAPTDGDGSVREHLAHALDNESEQARNALLACGIRVYPERDAFMVANSHAFVQRVYRESPWRFALEYARVLARLPGASRGWQARIEGWQLRGTMLPGALLDEFGR